MKNKVVIATLLLLAIALGRPTQARAIDTWKMFPSYADIQKIEYAGSVVFVLASDGLYSYNPADQSIQTYDKVNTLSDCGIDNIAWCARAGRLVVVYQNQNIDLVEPSGRVVNMPEYYNVMLTEDKTVNNIVVDGATAYLCTGFGIVRIDVANAVVSDTYNLGMSVNAVAIDGGYIYAATAEGMYKAPLTVNLADPSQWNRYSEKSFAWLFATGGNLIGLNNGEACAMDKNADRWTSITSPWFTAAKLCAGRVICYGRNSTYVIIGPGQRLVWPFMTGAIDCTSDGSTYWMEHTDGTLASATIDDAGAVTTLTSGIAPDGPTSNHFGFMMFKNGQLYTAGGQGNPERPACVQVYDGTSEWTTFQDDFAEQLGYRYYGAMSLDIDPTDPTHVALGTQVGMFEFRNGQFSQSHTIDNSPLQGASTVPDNSKRNYTIVSTVKFDSQGRLWCGNSVASSASLFEYHDNQWTSHHSSELMNNEGYSFSNMVGMMFDSRNLLWFGSDDWRRPALCCYNTTTDELTTYTNFVNQNGTSVIAECVNCLAEDLEGNIWIGTAAGPLMLTASDIASGGNTFTQVIVPRNDGTNYADYLLSGVSISAIAIDGAGRKWFGTENSGVFLISADNMTQLQHFTTDNSTLISDNIESIAINPTTGEVFFGTDKGLCSYMADATEAAESMDKDTVWAYPNPVRPEYTGLITVVGLTLDADVKITAVNGTLVAEGRSNGGTFTWNGCDKKGRRVASGVYMVQTATADGKKGTVCKIAVVN